MNSFAAEGGNPDVYLLPWLWNLTKQAVDYYPHKNRVNKQHAQAEKDYNELISWLHDVQPPFQRQSSSPLTLTDAAHATVTIAEDKINALQTVWDYATLIPKVLRSIDNTYREHTAQIAQHPRAAHVLRTFLAQRYFAARLFLTGIMSAAPANTLHVTALMIALLAIRDLYHFFVIIDTRYKKLTCSIHKSKSMTQRLAALVQTLYRKNNNAYDTKSTIEKITDLIDTIMHDISVGTIVITDQTNNEAIDITTSENRARALEIANIRFTIAQELIAIQNTIAFLKTYDHPPNGIFGQRSWHHDLQRANNQAGILTGTQFYEITTDMARKQNEAMLRPFRWYCSRGMPFSYHHAKQLWWHLTQQEKILTAFEALIHAS